MKERWYQKEAKEKAIEYIENTVGHPLVVCPTGSGKSLILSSVVKYFVDKSWRVLVLSHVAEILEQDEAALLRLIPSELVGVYSASLGRRERKPVTVAAIQSVYKKTTLFSSYDLIVIDEAHTVPLKGEGMYRTLFKNMPNCIVLGLTATPFRLGQGLLTEGEAALFTEIIYDVPVELLIKQGFLSPLLTKSTKTLMPTEDIKLVCGDYSKQDLSDKLDISAITEKVTAELIPLKDRYKCWLLFAIDIEHAEHICDMLNDKGVKSSTVHSKQKIDRWGLTRKETIVYFKKGSFQALVSVATLTTGFDHPAIDLVALIRPTMSPLLHVQMIGRGLRIHDKKPHCLIMDFSGNIMRLGPINDVKIPTPQGEKKAPSEAPIKVCPECRAHVPASALACYMCGCIFPPPSVKLTSIASDLSVVIDKPMLKGWFPVTRVSYSSYLSSNSRLSMRVTYLIGEKKVHEYVNPFGNTRSNYNWRNWWSFRTEETLPNTIQEMVSKSNLLSEPIMLKVDFKGAYPSIKDASF